jgi:hypothetical protein
MTFAACERRHLVSLFKRSAYTTAKAIACIGAVAIFGILTFSGKSRIDQQPIVVNNSDRRVVTVADSRDAVAVSFQLENRSTKPIRVLGVNTGCGCATVEKIPFAIPAGKVEHLKLSIVPRENRTAYELTPEVLVDVPTRPIMLSVTVQYE